MWPVETWHFAQFVQEYTYISMATFVCAHSTAILTNRGASELVEECISYALQVRTRTIQEKQPENYFLLYIVKQHVHVHVRIM